MKKVWKILIIVLLVLLVIAGIAFAVLNHYINMIKRVDPDAEVVTLEDEEEVIKRIDEEEKALLEEIFGTEDTKPDDAEPVDDEEETDEGIENLVWETFEPLADDELLNNLIVGQDRRPGQGRQRSDSMMVISVNIDTKEISMISFLRDLYVQIPGGYQDNRLNVPYVLGGFPLLKETLMTNFGISVDGCFEVDFEGFTALIDLLGGIDITLSQAEAYVVGDGAVEGYNHLNGTQTLAYTRIRKLDSDFGRTERQRKVMTYIYNSFKNSSLGELDDIADTILPYLTTDLTNAQIYEMLAKCFPILNGAQLTSYRVPADDAYYNAMVRGMAVLIPDLNMIREDLLDYLPLND